MGISQFLQPPGGSQVNFPLDLLVNIRFGVAGGKRGVFLQFEHIGRKVLHLLPGAELHGVQHLLYALAGQAQHNIQRDVEKARLPGQGHRLGRPIRRVGAPQLL